MVLQTQSFQAVPEFLPDEKEHRRQIARAVRGMIQGKINVVFPVTLRASQTTTTIQDSRISAYSAVVPAMATTANGAAAIAAGIYVTNLMPQTANTPGSAIIHHASNAATDQNITFLIIG